ncbi:DgyrCDS12504 [Dimorphilus gyrociliatus]|uniref:DgyrCDS12504 n=1 Tax=Dimorphilus gyrociliatus TaxID=2664684 RepID=A0A7I8W6M4_9ANNE|nr:DgyrCDS12504 [Dimorphilus gyrociliatus]
MGEVVNHACIQILFLESLLISLRKVALFQKDAVQRCVQLKEEGNDLFKKEQYKEAVKLYTKVIEDENGVEQKLACFKNRAACYLKLDKYEKAVKDCNEALKLQGNDAKALFRRCQSYLALEKYEDSYKDAMLLLKVEPKNSAIQPILRKLNPIIQNKVDEQLSTDNKIKQMLTLAFSTPKSDDLEKQKQALSNLIVLSREDSTGSVLLSSGIVEKLKNLINQSTDDEVKLSCIRVLACLVKDYQKRADEIFKCFTAKLLINLISHKNEDISTAAAFLTQKIITSLIELEKWRQEKEEHDKKKQENPTIKPFGHVFEKFDINYFEKVEEILLGLMNMINNHKIPAVSRDNVLELFSKIITRKDNCLGWTRKFMELDGLQKLLEISGSIPDEPIVPCTTNTRMHTTLLMSKIYDDLWGESEFDMYKKIADDYFTDMFGDEIMESKLQALLTLAALLQGPYEVGNHILGRKGVIELILALADSSETKCIKVAVEALVHSASKKERCSGVIEQAAPILRKLYEHRNENIRVRALVGLCKLSSFGGSDASIKAFSDGSQYEFADECRGFLKNPSKDVDLRRWAAEGLAFLSLNADIKEDLIEDSECIHSLISLARVQDKSSIYPISQVFTNLTNAFDKKEIDKELIELAKFSKQHVPEEHEKDGAKFVSNRIKKLVEFGITNALVSLSSTESQATREAIARVFLACTEDIKHRGLIVQHGGAKALLNLHKDNTKQGKVKAAHSLAKIAITTNPEIAFPGQRMVEVVRPLISLLGIDNTALENFEALMALTNLASMNDDSIVKRIVSEKGLTYIEHYVYEEHDMLRRAAVECFCNLVQYEDVAKIFLGENDRVKLFLLYCTEEDEALVRAASGALAVLTSEEEICRRVVSCTEQWIEILGLLASHPKPDIQHRGLFIIQNLTSSSKETCSRVIESVLFEALQAVSRIEEPDRKNSKLCAMEGLKNARKYGLIQANPDLDED